MPDLPEAGVPVERGGMGITSDPDEVRVEQPATPGARERLQFPLRLILASGLLPQAHGGEGWSALRRVTPHDLSEVMRQLHPRLAIEVPNRLDPSEGAARRLDVELAFPRLKAFRPDQIARQVPVLARLLTLRTQVARVRDDEVDLEAFCDAIREAGIDDAQAAGLYRALQMPDEPAVRSARRSTAKASPSADAPEREQMLDRIMGEVREETEGKAGEGDHEPADASRGEGAADVVAALGRAVSSSGENTSGAAPGAASRLLDHLDARLSAQVQVILGHPEVRRLEAAWRGLAFLVNRLDFRSGIQLEVLPVSKDRLGEALYDQVLVPEHEREPKKPPLSAIVLDFAFDNSRADLEQLQDLADTGASLQVPVIGSVGTAFFGVEKPGGLAKLPPLRQHLDGPGYIGWHKLRGREAARFLALAGPPFLLRGPYGRDQPVEAFAFEEEGALWGGAALVVTAACAESFARTGWPTHLEGRLLEDFPLFTGPAAKTPLAALLSEHRQRELAEAGFVVLAGRPNRDTVQVAQGPTVARPASQAGTAAQAEARAHVSLSCQLFVARAAAVLLHVQNELQAGGGTREAMQQEIERRLGVFLGGQKEGAVAVEPVGGADLPGQELVAVRLRPPEAVLAPDVSLVMGLQIPRSNEPRRR